MKTDYKSKKYYVGALFKTNEGYKIKIIGKDIRQNYYHFRFEDTHGYEGIAHSNHINRGNIKNPFKISVLGIGYFGDVKNRCIYFKKAYKLWIDIITRCIKDKNYRHVSLSKEWKNFAKFYEWFKNNYVEGWCIDKDLLSNESYKIYSESTCCFLPNNINIFISKKSVKGVTYNKKLKKWVSQMNYKNKKIHLGVFDNEFDARTVYLVNKQRKLNEMCKEYNFNENIIEKIYSYYL